MRSVLKKSLIVAFISVVMFTAAFYMNVLTGSNKLQPVFADSTNATSTTNATAGSASGPTISPVAIPQAQHMITVNGSGEVMVTPDVAYVNLGISSEADTAKQAQADNAQAYSKLKQVLFNQYNLDQKDVQTSNFSVQPKYRYVSNQAPEIVGYTATQTLRVTFRDLAHLGAFLDAASNAGVNHINGIQFSTEKQQQYELDAIKKAMANAQAKAKTIANFDNKNLTGMVKVTMQGNPQRPIVYANYSGMEKMSSSANTAATTSISAGQLKITTSVTVEYSFN